MSYRGRIKNGVIVLDQPADLPEGAEVEVRTVTPDDHRQAQPENGAPTLYDRLKDVIGIVDGLPTDMAENHDHYIHGTPKRA